MDEIVDKFKDLYDHSIENRFNTRNKLLSNGLMANEYGSAN